MRGLKNLGLIFGAFLCFQNPHAQSPIKPQKKEAQTSVFSIDPNRPQISLDTSSLDGKNSASPPLTKRRKRMRDVEEDDPEIASSNWARSTVGLFFAGSNNGIGQALWKRTEDELLIGHSTELAFGLGMNLDFNFPNSLDECLRLQVGAFKVNVHPDDDVSSIHKAGELEDSETLFNLALIYRFAFGEAFSIKTFWYGLGAQMNYVFATSRPDGGNPLSKLNNSYGFSPIIAVGADIPIASFDDLTFAAQYLPPRGYTLMGGFRTSL